MTMTGSCVRVARKPLQISTCSSTVDKKGSWLSWPLSPRYSLLPRSSYRTLSRYASQDFPMPLPHVAKAMKGIPHLPQSGGALNSQPQPRGRIFHCLTPIWFLSLYKLRLAPGPSHPLLPHTWGIRKLTPSSLLEPGTPHITTRNHHFYPPKGLGIYSNLGPFLLPVKTSHLVFRVPLPLSSPLHSPQVA